MPASPQTPKREKMSAVDTAWLRMDRPHNLMMISGVLLFRERLALARLRKVISDRFLVFKRFRQRAVETAGGAFWETDPRLRHRPSHRPRGAAGPRRPARTAGIRVAARAHATRSVAADVAVPPGRQYDGGSALVMRIHHSYADGIALVRVMLSMTDATANGPPAMPFAPQPQRKRDEPDDSLGQLLAPLSGVMKHGEGRSARR